MGEEYTYERISETRLSDIKSLYKDCFNEDVSMEFLQKKYDTKRFGANDIGYIAYDNSGKPAAYYGVFPCKAVIDEQVYLCAQSGDTMTHPNHRGKGLFIKLARITYELAKQNGVKFVYGFPNDNSYHGFVNKLGWAHKEDFNEYRKLVLTFPLLYLCNKFSFLSGLYSAYSKMILKNKLSSKFFFQNSLLSDKNTAGIFRDKDFFDYKNYFKKDIIEIDGKCVYIKILRTKGSASLRIGDLESTDKENFYSMIKKLNFLSFLLGANYLVFYYSPGTEYDRYLSEKYKGKKYLAIGWVDLGSELELNKLKFAQADHDIY